MGRIHTVNPISPIDHLSSALVLVLPAVAVGPLVLEDAVALAVEDPAAGALLAVLAGGPCGELQLPRALALESEGQGDDGGEAIDAGKEGEETLLEEDFLRDADGTERETPSRVCDPRAGPLDLVAGELAELGHAEDQEGGLAFLGHACPVVAVVRDLGVDLECEVGEGVGRQSGASLEDGDSVQDVRARGDDLSEVVLLEVGDEGLDLRDRTLLEAVEQTIEGGEIVNELSIYSKKLVRL